MALIWSHQSRYHSSSNTTASPGDRSNDAAKKQQPRLPMPLQQALTANPEQPELWAAGALDQFGWHFDGTDEGHAQLEDALKVRPKPYLNAR
eukprot:scaffold658189_cov48-Prasinocladus_malaysianus.AAC.1